LRLAILALLASKRHPERAADDLRVELPDFPALAVVEYHLGVLREVGLVSEREVGSTTIYGLASEW
jgi:predicted transcriptional regulator